MDNVDTERERLEADVRHLEDMKGRLSWFSTVIGGLLLTQVMIFFFELIDSSFR